MGTVSVDEDSPAAAIDLTQVFFDPDVANSGDALTYSIISNSQPGLVNPQITAGTLTLPLSADANGQAIIVVEASDSSLPTPLTRRDTLTLTVRAINDGPRLVGAIPTQNVSEDAVPIVIDLSPTYFVDPDGALDSLTFSLISNSNALLVTPTLSGSQLTLTLVPNQFGSAQITLSATDSNLLALTSSFILNVAAVNDAPTVANDSYTVPQFGTLITTDVRETNGNPADNGVLANDTDLEGNSMTAFVTQQPLFGNLTFNSNGTFTYTHTGSTRLPDSFKYRAFDGQSNSVEATVTILVGAPIPPKFQNPVIHNDVNADGVVSAIDALLIVNYINTVGTGPITAINAPPPFIDANGDNQVTAIDVLEVIFQLNQQVGSEGEASTDLTTVATTTTDTSVTSGWVYSVSRVNDNQNVGVVAVPVSTGVVIDTQEAQALGLISILDDQDVNACSVGDWATTDGTTDSSISDAALDDLMAEWYPKPLN